MRWTIDHRCDFWLLLMRYEVRLEMSDVSITDYGVVSMVGFVEIFNEDYSTQCQLLGGVDLSAGCLLKLELIIDY